MPIVVKPPPSLNCSGDAGGAAGSALVGRLIIITPLWGAFYITRRTGIIFCVLTGEQATDEHVEVLDVSGSVDGGRIGLPLELVQPPTVVGIGVDKAQLGSQGRIATGKPTGGRAVKIGDRLEALCPAQ